MNRPSNRAGFSLVEVLVVIAIIAVLLGLALVALLPGRGAGDRIKCQNNLHQIGIALRLYHDNEKAFPPALSWTAPYYYLSWMGRLLPYMERDRLWQDTEDAYKLRSWPWYNPPHTVLGTNLPNYVCPSDPRSPMVQIYSDSFDPPRFPPFRVAFTSYLGVEGTDLFCATALSLPTAAPIIPVTVHHIPASRPQ